MTDEQGWARALWRGAAAKLPARARDLLDRIVERDLLLEASSLAFYGLVSALPLLTLTFTIVSAVAGEDQLRQVVERLDDEGPAGVGRLLEQLLENSDTMSWAAIVFTLWPATAYGGGLRRALQRPTSEEAAPALRGRATGIGLILALPVLSLAGLPLMTVLTALGSDGVAGAVLGWALAVGGGVVTLTAVIAALYHAFTPDDLSWRHTIRGAALTATITTLFSIGFVVYLRLGQVEERFGGETVGLVVMLGVYLFVANALLLAGFEAADQLDDEDEVTGSPRR